MSGYTLIQLVGQEEAAAMSCYTQLTMPERMRLYTFLEMGLSKIQIAQRLGRHRSTIYREVQRNRRSIGYLPGIAHRKSQKRRADKPGKIRTGPRLYDYILRGLKRGLSPEQIAGRMKREVKPFYVCHETIYRYIYRLGNKGLYRLLHYKKRRRGNRWGRKVGSGKYCGITLITERPQEIESREEFGHWEGDTIAFSNTKYLNVATYVERKTRFVVLDKHADRKTATVLGALECRIQRHPSKLWKTVTFDQGSEFADYRPLERRTRCKTYFCEPHSPWQRGSNENMNGRLRRYLPRSIDIQAVTQENLNDLAKKINNIPRKCLDYMTPREALLQCFPSYCRTSL
jgi:IS30 family transposase